MSFQIQIFRLVQLQRLDLKLDAIQQQRQQIPQRLHAAQVSVDHAQQRLKEVRDSLASATAERQSGEQDLSEHEHRIGELRERLGKLKTNKEYQAHLFEIELAGKKKDALEETILRAMERVEAVQLEQDDVLQRVQDATMAMEKEKGELASLDAGLAREVAHIERETPHLWDALDQQIGRHYTRLKSSMPLPVAVSVSDGTCRDGCQLQIPMQQVASVKRADQLQVCPYCGRLLYDEALLAAAHGNPDADPIAGEPGER